MFTKILFGILALAVAILIVAAFQPSTFKVTRSITVNAPAAVLYGLVGDFRAWPNWSPWENKDPAMKRTISGSPAGVGASYAWEGNGDVGSGRMTITECRPNQQILIKLEFIKPMHGECPTEFVFQDQNGQTKVTWTMSGINNYLAKVMCLFMNMDKMVGGDFETGLANLKRVAEKSK